ncbi:hypothetical protein MferCBS31731_005032 [Microsporum ferrugineum]
MISGQGSHFAQVNVGKKKKQGKGRHRLAPPAAKPAAANKSPAQVRSAILADAAPSENKAPVEKPRPLSFTQASANSSSHARGPSDATSGSHESTQLARGAHSHPSPTWSAEDSKIGVHNDRNAASKAAASAAFFGKKDSHKEQAHSPLSSMRTTENPRRDSSTLGVTHRTEEPTIGAFPEAADNAPSTDNHEAIDTAEEEEEYKENEWEDSVVHDSTGSNTEEAVESNPAVPAVKEENEWVKEETDETPQHRAHTTQRHSEVTEYLPESAVGGVSGKQIERKIEKDTVEKEIIEKSVDKAASEDVAEPVKKPSYAAMVAKPWEPSPPPAAATPVASEVEPTPKTPPTVAPPPPPAQTPAPDASTVPATVPAPAAAPVPIPAPIPVPLMKQETPATAEKSEQEEPPDTTSHEDMPATKQEVPTVESLGVATPAVPVKSPERLIPTDPIVPGKVPALASAEDQVKAAVASSSAIKSPTNNEAIRKQDKTQTSQLTHQQKKEVEKEEKARAKQKAKEQKARDKEFKRSQKHLRKGSTSHLPPGNGGAKRLRLRDRIMNRIARLLN